MKYCESCGAQVSEDFVRVMYPTDEVPICPDCPDVASTRFTDELVENITGETQVPGL